MSARVKTWNRLGVDRQVAASQLAQREADWKIRSIGDYGDEYNQMYIRVSDIHDCFFMAVMEHLELIEVDLNQGWWINRASVAASEYFVGGWRKKYEATSRGGVVARNGPNLLWFDEYRIGLLSSLVCGNDAAINDLVFWVVNGGEIAFDEGVYSRSSVPSALM